MRTESGGRYTHSTFVEMGTNKSINVHRKCSNVKYGNYYFDYDDEKEIRTIINSLDMENPWPAKYVSIGNPHIGDGKKNWN